MSRIQTHKSLDFRQVQISGVQIPDIYWTLKPDFCLDFRHTGIWLTSCLGPMSMVHFTHFTNVHFYPFHFVLYSFYSIYFTSLLFHLPFYYFYSILCTDLCTQFYSSQPLMKGWVIPVQTVPLLFIDLLLYKCVPLSLAGTSVLLFSSSHKPAQLSSFTCCYFPFCTCMGWNAHFLPIFKRPQICVKWIILLNIFKSFIFW